MAWGGVGSTAISQCKHRQIYLVTTGGGLESANLGALQVLLELLPPPPDIDI
jgi:hypothetical protein